MADRPQSTNPFRYGDLALDDAFTDRVQELQELKADMRNGQNVVVSQFCFAIYPIVAKMMGAEIVTVPAKKHGHDLPAMLRAITPRTSIVFVANPNNPTGTLAPREEVVQFINDVPDDVLGQLLHLKSRTRHISFMSSRCNINARA